MRFSHMIFVIALLTVTAAGLAQYTLPGYQPDTSRFPYIAEVTGDNVYVRSGPGTQHYHCLKLNKGDRVKVVGIKNNWARIAPPVDSYSWVSQRYIKVDPNTPNIGTVIAEVTVRAGSSDGNPLHSDADQTSLKRGERVIVLDSYKNDYYKIAPPQGVYLWVSVQFTQPLGQSSSPVEPSVSDIPDIIVDMGPVVTDDPNLDPNSPALVPTRLSSESKLVDNYRELEKQLAAEKTKPLNQQDYSQLKEKLQAIAADNDAGKVARYAQFALKQVSRYELALKIIQETKLQDSQFQKIKENIENARQAKLAEIQQLGKYAAVGQFTISAIYGRNEKNRHFQILDPAGNIMCFAVPASKAADINFDEYLGKRVGLVGTIEPHLPTSKALVKFTDIEILK